MSKSSDRISKRQKTSDVTLDVKQLLPMQMPLCMICLEVISVPMLMCVAELCGETFHEECINTWLAGTCRDNYSGSCPKCRQEFIAARNRTLQTLLESVGTDCVNKDRGCTEHMPHDDMHNHQLTCAFRLMECAASQYKCNWRGLESERVPHETNCMYVLFGQQAIDVVERIEATGEATSQRISDSVSFLNKLKDYTEKRIRQLDQLRKTLVVEGLTKHYLVPIKTREHPLNVQESALKMQLDCDNTKDTVVFSVCGNQDSRYPVAVVAIIFILSDNTVVVGPNSNINSFILRSPEPYEIFRTKLNASRPVGTVLNFKLVIKLFY